MLEWHQTLPLFASSQIAIEMLESGKVDAVVCVQSDENDRFSPKPVRDGCAGGMGCARRRDLAQTKGLAAGKPAQGTSVAALATGPA
jgi:hypothetical protein